MKKTSPIATEATSHLPVDSVEWYRIEFHYREGVMSILEIASENGISSALILRKAREEGWPAPSASNRLTHLGKDSAATARRYLLGDQADNCAQGRQKEANDVPVNGPNPRQQSSALVTAAPLAEYLDGAGNGYQRLADLQRLPRFTTSVSHRR